MIVIYGVFMLYGLNLKKNSPLTHHTPQGQAQRGSVFGFCCF